MRPAGSLLLILLLTACASLPERWPEGAPPRAYFEEVYAADARNRQLEARDDYLLWVSRFYSGVPPVAGWLDLSEAVLATLTEPERGGVAARLLELGAKISSDWAKSNELRVIDNRVGNVWRAALDEALNQGDIEGFLDRLEADVDALLSGELDAEQVRFERYYEDEFSF